MYNKKLPNNHLNTKECLYVSATEFTTIKSLEPVIVEEKFVFKNSYLSIYPRGAPSE
jgi:hypothetical protein